jgi:4'-phosphopantetheinyl transferase EntD
MPMSAGSESSRRRAPARSALAQLGVRPAPITSVRRGEPIWPPGVVGSRTHCTRYRGVAVARDDLIAAIGIDAEPHVALPRSGLGHI